MRHALLCLAVVAAPLAVQAADEWQVVESVDEMTDAKSTSLTLKSESGEQTLMVTCTTRGPMVAVLWKSLLTLDRDTDIMQRLGTKPADTVRWSVAGDHRMTIHPMREADASRFVREELAPEKRLLLRASPHGEGYETAAFNLEGLDVRIGRLPECFGK
jgi:hypothetical protein